MSKIERLDTKYFFGGIVEKLNEVIDHLNKAEQHTWTNEEMSVIEAWREGRITIHQKRLGAIMPHALGGLNKTETNDGGEWIKIDENKKLIDIKIPSNFIGYSIRATYFI